MPDKIHRTFVNSFINYLKKQVESQTLSADAQESAEVAIQCLGAAFGEDEDEEQWADATNVASTDTSSEATGAGNEIDLFELYQSVYVERNPESLQIAEKIKNEGNRLMKDGKYNEALLQYNRAITFDPKNPIFYCNRAAAFIRLGDNERAVTDCKSALVYNTSYGKAYGRLGIAYSNLGKYEEAQQAYAKAIELEPDNQDYRNNLEVARNARSQTQASMGVGAIPQLTEGLNAMLSNPAIRNLFSSAEIDLDQLQNMSQNPIIMNAIGQMFTGLQSGAPNPGMGAVPPMPNDMLQLFQSFASQLANPRPNANQGNTEGDNTDRQPRDPQPPASS